MAAIKWDSTGERFFEMGVKKGVLYPIDNEGNYTKGVAWNGLTSVAETPDGAEATDLYADDIKYASFRSAEKFGGTVEAYMFPDEWYECDGSAELAPGVYLGQQTRKKFGMSYVTQIGNDVQGDGFGYKLHLVYGATASPSERTYESINDSPDAITFSWDFETAPVDVAGHKPTSLITINSLKADPTKLKALEAILYGAESQEPRLPMPDEVYALMKSDT